MIPRLFVLLFLTASLAPAEDAWKHFRFLLGDWTGAGGSAETGPGSGSFSFQLDVAGKVLLRRNLADYPASQGKAAVHHEDLMLIYSAQPGEAPQALYVDSEGHVIHYESEFSANPPTVRFTSPAAPGGPRYRLTYRQTGDATLAGQFEVAPPGKPDGFATYMSWTAKRKP